MNDPDLWCPRCQVHHPVKSITDQHRREDLEGSDD